MIIPNFSGTLRWLASYRRLAVLIGLAIASASPAQAQSYKRHVRVDLGSWPLSPPGNPGCYSFAYPATGLPGPGWGLPGAGSGTCPIYQIRLAGYSCSTNAFEGSSSEYGGSNPASACCECDPQGGERVATLL